MKISEFTKGWLVGNFEPAIIKNEDIEVGIKFYRKGDYEPRHVHKLTVEYTVLAKGEIRMNGKKYCQGEIVKVQPGDATDFEVISDEVITLVIKSPSIPSDKYMV